MGRIVVALVTILVLGSLASCTDGSTGSTEEAEGPPEESELVLQAVDAGTGGALADEEMTVRHLVRSPITLDAFATETVPSTRPYRISHSVGEDSLVVEVRFEAPSYYRLDTAFAVPRGGTAGPLTVRLARRLDRVASTGGSDSGGAGGGARPGSADGGAASTGSDGASTGAAGAAPETGTTGPSAAGPDAGVDREPLEAGNRAFESQDWVGATVAYDRMPAPSDPSGSYGRSYQQALVRQGISHIRLGEWGSALDVLERAAGFPGASALAYYHLGRAECAVGRLDQGRASLDQVEARRSTLPAGERGRYLLLADYQRGICNQLEFERADEPTELLRLGGQAMRTLEAFVEEAEPVASSGSEVAEAVEDARERAEEIRSELLQLGRN